MIRIDGIDPGTHSQHGVHFPRRSVPLHAMISSCGHARETSRSYDWDGLKRGDAEFVLFQYTLDGAGRLTYDGADFVVGPGQAMILHFPHTNRYYLPPDSEAWEFLYLCLYGSEVMRIWHEVERVCGPVVPFAADDPVAAGAARIYRAVAAGGVTSAFQASSLAYQFAMDLAQRLLAQTDDTTLPEPIERSIRFARQNISHAITVDDLAAQAGLSRSHFSRLFARHTGEWPGRYLRDLRLRRAITLLETTDGTIADIAATCGFCDATYLCKVFRRSYGMTPQAYRRSGMYPSSPDV